MPARIPSALVVVAAVLALSAGCGGTHESSVYGTVYLNDKPLPLGSVSFYPTQGGAAAISQIASDGTYRLNTGSEQGLAPGEYKVTVMATEKPAAVPVGQAPPPGRPITPLKYGTVEQTDLVHTVKPGENKIDLRLMGN
jgi:hypothetical protein